MRKPLIPWVRLAVETAAIVIVLLALPRRPVSGGAPAGEGP